MKTRNPIARVIHGIPPKIVPDKRYEKEIEQYLKQLKEEGYEAEDDAAAQ